MAKGVPGGLIEEASGIDQRGRCDHRRYPMEHVARRSVSPGPYRYREQHDVRRSETGHGNRPDQLVAQGVGGLLRRGEQMRFIAGRGNGTGELDRIGRCLSYLVPPDDGNALGREIDPCALHLRPGYQRPLDRADAGAAMHGRNAEVGLQKPLTQIPAGEPELFRRRKGMARTVQVQRTFRSGCAATHLGAP